MSEVSENYTNMSAGDDVDEFILIPTLDTKPTLTIVNIIFFFIVSKIFEYLKNINIQRLYTFLYFKVYYLR